MVTGQFLLTRGPRLDSVTFLTLRSTRPLNDDYKIVGEERNIKFNHRTRGTTILKKEELGWSIVGQTHFE